MEGDEHALVLPNLVNEDSEYDDDGGKSNGGGDEERSDDWTRTGHGGGGRRDCGDGPTLKKGPWTPEEDKILKDYVEKHGDGNWNQVQRNSGLNRCGKSCRLRWANHLKSGLKKGPFDEEEEQLILMLHAKMGNKWAKMATHLPGRTDNEIKNFWNTRSKRLLRDGMPLYPESILSRVSNQEMHSHSLDEPRGKKRTNECSQGNGMAFEEVIFERFDYQNAENLIPPNIAANPLSIDAINPFKRHASSVSVLSSYDGSITSEQSLEEPEKMYYSTDFNFGITKDLSLPFGSTIDNEHLILDSIQNSMEPPSVQTDCYYPSQRTSSALSSESFCTDDTDLLDTFFHEEHRLVDPTLSQGTLEDLIAPFSYNQGFPSNFQSDVFPMDLSSLYFGDNLLESNLEFQPSQIPPSKCASSYFNIKPSSSRCASLLF
ncbi:hypothetical protein GUJ93_ZPchr0006g41804 [Zizania palustris]|uniref:Transcription factor GAMYB n=1 Tax=Zizania palustris TaxID=103762 RepID=A0A8J5T004_ZIZPA|nr:hypothetical protein GUJ93_ZPchr0006g41804 [Zizania palustris]